MNRMGIIGSGPIGSAIARLAVAAGYDVLISNSRGPESLTELIDELGPLAQAGTSREAAEFGEVPVLAVPLGAYRNLPIDAFAEKTVLATGNYYPHRDGRIEKLDGLECTTAEYEQSLLPGAVIVKVFNNIVFHHIPALAHSTPRTALPVAALPDQVVVDHESLLERGVRIREVPVVDVDVVSAQSAQALLDLTDDVAARQAGVRVEAPLTALGRQHDPVAAAGECAAQDLLGGLPFRSRWRAGPVERGGGAVDVGGVEEGDAEIQRSADHIIGVLRAGGHTEGGTAQGDLRDPDPTGSEDGVLHGEDPFALPGSKPLTPQYSPRRPRTLIRMDDDAIELAHQMLDMARRGDAQPLLALVDQGAPVDLRGADGNTLLMLAAYHDHPTLVEALASRGADVDLLNDRGQSPLAGAAFKGYTEVARVLLKAGADPDLGEPSGRATAQYFGREDITALLD